MDEFFQIILLLGFIVFAWYCIDFITGKNSNKEKKPVKKKFKLPKGIYYLIGLNVFLLLSWLYSEANFTDLIIPEIKIENSTSYCNEFDKTGSYMDIALNEVRTTGSGFLITGSQFIDDTYLVQGYSPEYGVPIDVAMKINVCGEIVDVDL